MEQLLRFVYAGVPSVVTIFALRNGVVNAKTGETKYQEKIKKRIKTTKIRLRADSLITLNVAEIGDGSKGQEGFAIPSKSD